MIGQVVAGQAMNQYIKSVPVLIEPGDESVKRCAVKRKLATPVRMRPDLALMHAASNNAKKFARPLAQASAGFLGAALVEHDPGQENLRPSIQADAPA